jgi:membrane protein YdbS with pleckstrin-like domain
MQTMILKPDQRLRNKYYLMLAIWGGIILGLSILFAVLIGRDAGGAEGGRIGLYWALGLNLLWILPLALVAAPYVNSLQYEIHEDEVIVRGGIITKSVKHVPFRTVTNLRTSQGPFDRLFGLGTLDIQTAGMSGQTGAEEKLSGLPNFVEIYDRVAQALRRYRQAMGPTASEDEPMMNAEASLQAILQELRAIRSSLEKDEA